MDKSIRSLLLITSVIAGGTILLTISSSVGLKAATGGEAIFEKRCGGCHAADRDKEGPRLSGVFGRRAGAVRSFQYSTALKESKVTWDATTLDQWLADSDKLVPNNDMSFRVENLNERREIIDYLKALSSSK